MQILSVLIGIICVIFVIPGLIPGFGWTLWAPLFGSLVGITFGSFPQRKIGLTICLAVAFVAALRLFLAVGVL